MKKLALLVACAGLGLISAHPPEQNGHRPREARGGYPPCSATVTDRCIQLYERGVSTRRNLARNARLPRATEMAGASRAGHRRALARRVRMAGERG